MTAIDAGARRPRHRTLPGAPMLRASRGQLPGAAPLGLGPHSPRLLTDVPTASRAVIDAIDGARHTIDAAFFALRAGGSGERVAASLMRAARRGVRVDIVLDAVGNNVLLPKLPPAIRFGSAERNQLRELRRAGVNVRLTYPIRDVRTVIGVDHRKALVADDRVAIAGGMNFLELSDTWTDAMVRVTGADAARLGALLRARGIRIAGGPPDAAAMQAIAGLQRVDPEVAAPIDSVVSFENDPKSGVDDASRHLFARLRKARRRVWLTSPFLSNKAIAQELERLARSGVEVRVMTSGAGLVGGGKGHAVQRALTLGTGHRAFAAGARWIETAMPIHAKIALIDDEAIVSSLNLTRQSHTRDVELLMASRSPEFVGQVADFAGRLAQGATEVPVDTPRTVLDHIVGWAIDNTSFEY